MIPIEAYEREKYQRTKVKSTITKVNSTITHHVREFSQYLPFRRCYNFESYHKKKLTPASYFLTPRSVLLHFSDNFIYLFGLHLIVMFPFLDFTCEFVIYKTLNAT